MIAVCSCALQTFNIETQNYEFVKQVQAGIYFSKYHIIYELLKNVNFVYVFIINYCK